MKKTLTKVLILIACAIMLVTASVLGTLAYLTSQAKVTNTFTVGQVDIDLDEAEVNPDGTIVDEDQDGNPDDRVDGNNYHLIPGQTYVKDPTVTVKAGSENSYVRMLVTINKLAELDAIFAPTGADLMSIFNGYIDTQWVYSGETESNNTITYEFRYYSTVDAPDDANVMLPALFTSFTLPGTITGEQLATIQGMEITVVGHAIQATGFANADEAWAAFDLQNSTT